MNRNILLTLAVVAVVAVGIIGAYEMFGTLEYTPDTETNRVIYDPLGWGYFVWTGGQTDRTGNTEELLDDIAYISSWKPDDVSEKIVIRGKTLHDASVKFDWYEFRVYLDPEGNWENPMYYSSPNHPCDKIYWVNNGGPNPGRFYFDDYDPHHLDDWFANMSQIIEIIGPAGNMFLRVEWVVHVSSLTYSRTFVIHDEARILDGSGRVVVQPSEDGDDVFEVGETITFLVSTGASGPSVGERTKGWQLRLYNPDGVQYTKDGFPMNLSDFLENHPVRWTIPEDAWRPDWSNRWYVRLYNTLIEQYADWFFTVDVAEKQPTMVSINVDKPYPKIGDVITVTLVGQPSQYTQLPINHFIVDVYYGYTNNVERFIMENAMFPAENNQATFTFIVDSVGHVTIEARCADSQNRVSSPLIKGLDVSGEEYPTMRVGPSQYFVYHVSEDIHYPIFPDYKPEIIIYKFIDSGGKVVYIMQDENFIRQKTGESGGNQYWHIEDDVSFQVPAFPKTGTWSMIIIIADKDAWLISDQSLATRSTSFTVVKGSLSQNLLAPKYFHLNLLVFDKWIKIPAFYSIIIIIAVVIMLFIVFKFIMGGSVLKALQNVGKKKESKSKA